MKLMEEGIMIEHDREEEGSALIIVLGLITVISLLAMTIVTISQLTDKISKVTCDRSRSAYLAESAVERTIWLLRHDIATHPSRKLGKVGEEDEGERFLADGRGHDFGAKDEEDEDYGIKVTVSIFDAVSGIDVSGSRPTRYLQKNLSSFEEDPLKLENYKLFLNYVVDYVDSNDFLQITGGFEKDDYDSIDMFPLPRNYSMQYKYEMCWIPGFGDFFTVDKYGRIPSIRIIAPLGLRKLRGNANFFSSNDDELRMGASLDLEQESEVMAAKKALLEDSKSLSESLSPDLFGKLQQRFSFHESGFYTFIAKVSLGDGRASRIFTLTTQVTNNISTTKGIRYYEWRFLR